MPIVSVSPGILSACSHLINPIAYVHPGIPSYPSVKSLPPRAFSLSPLPHPLPPPPHLFPLPTSFPSLPVVPFPISPSLLNPSPSSLPRCPPPRRPLPVALIPTSPSLLPPPNLPLSVTALPVSPFPPPSFLSTTPGLPLSTSLPAPGPCLLIITCTFKKKIKKIK